MLVALQTNADGYYFLYANPFSIAQNTQLTYCHFYHLWCVSGLGESTKKTYSKPMHILGIDPGLATIGLGRIKAVTRENMQALDWLTIQTPAGLALPDRLLEIQTDLLAYINAHTPDLVVIEKLYFTTNVKTAIDVAQARGVLVATVAALHIPIVEATPLQLKQTITGDGKADKRQVQDMVKRLLQLTEIPQPDDAADGLALAIYGALHATW